MSTAQLGAIHREAVEAATWSAYLDGAAMSWLVDREGTRS